ncbi:MAG: hypothetical protein L0332_19840 [Chloroflexi bacterium]|nr:hypothetical protein [Chloroflexota bacterium]MCI0578651.1 hypothetical protein [Chloroflexota bacterium]MCI0647224.1 hypothetical protein [Chloroflexota bacterium]MCI0728950.1 hypothetical protein [Chloroflexota bacterium]
MDYGYILTRTWQLVWRHKFLWLLGLLAILARPLGSVIIRLAFRPRLDFQSPTNPFEELLATYERLARPGLLIAVVVVFFLVFLALWLISAIAEGGLIRAVAGLQKGQVMTAGQAWSAGLGLLGRFVAIDTILFLPLFLIALFLMLAALGGLVGLAIAGSRPGSTPDNFFSIMGLTGAVVAPLLCLLLPVGLLTVLFRLLAFRGAALQELGTRASIRYAWQLLRANLADIIILAVLLWAVTQLAGTLIALVLLFPLASLDMLPLFMLLLQGQLPGPQLGVGIAVIGMVVVLLTAVPVAVIHTYQSAAWTLAYQSWTAGEPAASRLVVEAAT